MDAPGIHDATTHLLLGNPFIVIVLVAMQRSMGEVVEADAVALVFEMRIEGGAALLPLAQVELYGEVGAGGLDIARCLGGLNGGELPQPVEVTVDGHFVAAAQQQNEQ